MTPRALICVALYGATTFLGAWPESWALAMSLGGLVGLAGLGLEARLRSFFDDHVSCLATLALLTSVSLYSNARGASPWPALLFVASCAGFYGLAANPSRGPLRLTLAALLASLPTLASVIGASWRSISPDNLLVALFGARGLLYGAPLLWAGFLGLVALRHEQPGLTRLALAGIAPGALGLLLATDRADVSIRTVIWLPFLLPGLAHCFERVRAFATRRPERVLVCAGAALALWNALFMEQYRRRLLPSDDTVSFAQVTSNSAGLVSRFAGTPVAWPANWIFAWRFNAPPDQWDAIADRRLFAGTNAAAVTIEFGDDESVFAPDLPLLLEGFGIRRTCERGWCRDVDGTGRVLLPPVDEGRGLVAIRLRLRGQGALTLSLNGAITSVFDMTESLSEVTLPVPARAVKDFMNVLSLSVAGGGKATVDRLTLERDLSTSSAR